MRRKQSKPPLSRATYITKFIFVTGGFDTCTCVLVQVYAAKNKSAAQIASENHIHPNQIHKWKKQALENFIQLFQEDRQGARAGEAEHEKELNELYAEIGRLSAQLSWLKKICLQT